MPGMNGTQLRRGLVDFEPLERCEMVGWQVQLSLGCRSMALKTCFRPNFPRSLRACRALRSLPSCRIETLCSNRPGIGFSAITFCTPSGDSTRPFWRAKFERVDFSCWLSTAPALCITPDAAVRRLRRLEPTAFPTPLSILKMHARWLQPLTITCPTLSACL